MITAVIFAALLAAPQTNAATWEEANAGVGAQVAAGAAKLAPKTQSRARILAGKPKSADLSMIFELGSKPEPEDLTGWIAGRRFTESGPTAALLVGGDILTDANQGPLGGKTFKVILFGADKAGITPADYYDEPGTYAVDTVTELVRDNAGDWSAVRYTQSGAVFSKGDQSFEVRRWGRYLVCKYSTGGYGYFFKKLMPLTTNEANLGASKGIPQQPQGILALPGSDQLSALFDQGTRPADKDIDGWFAGRRYVAGGPVAALVAGVEIYDNPAAGPIEGSTTKVLVFGPSETGVVPADLYDLGGSATINGLAWNIRESAANWTTTRTNDGFVTSNGDKSYEIRKSGEFLVVRYADGFGYAFKRIR